MSLILIVKMPSRDRKMSGVDKNFDKTPSLGYYKASNVAGCDLSSNTDNNGKKKMSLLTTLVICKILDAHCVSAV